MQVVGHFYGVSAQSLWVPPSGGRVHPQSLFFPVPVVRTALPRSPHCPRTLRTSRIRGPSQPEHRGLKHKVDMYWNSLALEILGRHFKNTILNLVSLIDIFRSSSGNALWWMPRDLTYDKLTLLQVGLLPTGNQPLTESMLTQFYVAIWLCWATMSKQIHFCTDPFTTTVYNVSL